MVTGSLSRPPPTKAPYKVETSDESWPLVLSRGGDAAGQGDTLAICGAAPTKPKNYRDFVFVEFGRSRTSDAIFNRMNWLVFIGQGKPDL